MKKRKTTLGILIFAAALAVGACSNSGSKKENSDGSSVKIDNQEWMTKNLNVSTFRNGDFIPEVKTTEEWERASKNKQPTWCYYDNDTKNGEKYGKLYNWYAVNDPRGLAPKGWHVPSDEEWTQLTDFLGRVEVAGTKMKSKKGWNENGNGSNESGFSGLPGGNRTYGSFLNIGNIGNWWSSTEYNTDYAWYYFLRFYPGRVNRSFNDKMIGFSVRCLRD